MSLSMRNKKGLSVRETVTYAVLATILFTSKLVMEALPNIHLCGVLIAVYTIALRGRALIPMYLFVLLIGLYGGFSPWWLPYLYIWLPIVGVFLLIPQKWPKKVKFVIYPIALALHGLLYGTLYAPAQALMFDFSFEQTLAWIASGIPFDLLHCAGNFCLGFLVLPLSDQLVRLSKGLRVQRT